MLGSILPPSLNPRPCGGFIWMEHVFALGLTVGLVIHFASFSVLSLSPKVALLYLSLYYEKILLWRAHFRRKMRCMFEETTPTGISIWNRAILAAPATCKREINAYF